MHSAPAYFATPEARDRRIQEHLPLVKYCVRSMHLKNAPSGLDFEDLVGHGTLGLIQAVDRFDDSQGVKFSNFAITRIRGAVLDAMRGLDPMGRTTRHATKRIADQFNTLALEFGRTPTSEEVRTATGYDSAKYWSARRAASVNLVSLDLPMDDGSSLADRLGDDAPSASSRLESKELSSALADAIAALPERDRRVLSLYYVEGLTMSAVARVMGVSETRVSQLLARTYARLRADRSLAAAA